MAEFYFRLATAKPVCRSATLVTWPGLTCAHWYAGYTLVHRVYLYDLCINVHLCAVVYVSSRALVHIGTPVHFGTPVHLETTMHLGTPMHLYRDRTVHLGTQVHLGTPMTLGTPVHFDIVHLCTLVVLLYT